MGNGQYDEARVKNDVEQAKRVPPQGPLAHRPMGHRGPDRRDLRRLRDQRHGGGHGGVEPERGLLTPLAVPCPFLEELRALRLRAAEEASVRWPPTDALRR